MLILAQKLRSRIVQQEKDKEKEKDKRAKEIKEEIKKETIPFPNVPKEGSWPSRMHPAKPHSYPS